MAEFPIIKGSTLTLTLDRVILHTIMHHSASTYMPNFSEIKEMFCGRTGGRTLELGLGLWLGLRENVREGKFLGVNAGTQSHSKSWGTKIIPLLLLFSLPFTSLFPPLLFLSFPSHSFPLFLLPLEVGPLNSAEGSGRAL